VDTVHTVERSEDIEAQAEADERFAQIVETIELAPLSGEELEELVKIPVAKDAGTQDQGYRFD